MVACFEGRSRLAPALSAWLGLIVAALSLVTPVRAAEGLYLAWDDCRSGSGVPNKAFACDANDVVLDLFCAFQPPADFGVDVVGIEAVVDVQHSLPQLPDWWQMGFAGCRQGELLANADFSAGGDCLDPWGGIAGAAEIQNYTVGTLSPSHARIVAVAGVLAKNAVALDGDGIYYGVRIRFRSGHSAGTGSCSGCLAPACLVLNGITIRRLAGSPGGDPLMVTPGFSQSNWVTWRGGAGADCMLVPTRAVTWGAVKTLYR